MTSAPCQTSAAPALDVDSLAASTEQALAVTDPLSNDQDADTVEDSASKPKATHAIPPDVLARLKAAHAQGDAGSCWTYELYRDADDNPPAYHYCRSLADSEKYAKLFLGEPYLGLDLEWKPNSFTSARVKDNVSSIQLASQTRVAVFHVALHTGDTPDELVAPTLRQILEDPDVLKAGVQVGGDANRLRKHLAVNVASVYELSPLYRTVTFGPTNRAEYNRRLVGLTRQIEQVFGLPLYKGDDVRSSDWTRPLTKQQVVYAATDAYAGWWLYTALRARWHAMHPRPPLPKPASRAAAAPSAPAANAARDDGEPTGTRAAPRRRPAKRSNDQRVRPPPSPELEAAERWLAKHAHPAAQPLSLRAYALWHACGLSVAETAAALRRPPVSVRHVAACVADALACSWREKPGLPIDPARAQEIAALLEQAQCRAFMAACNLSEQHEWTHADGAVSAARGASRPDEKMAADADADADARYFSESEPESLASDLEGADAYEHDPDWFEFEEGSGSDGSDGETKP